MRVGTDSVKPYLCPSYSLPDEKRMFLVDTLGFDDSSSGRRSDTDILSDIATFLNTTYQNDILLTGIIYLHRFSDNRVGGSGLRQMNMFRKLCGERSMKNIVIATTMWDTTSPTDGTRREQELMTEDGFFKQMLRNGAVMKRQDHQEDSTNEIIQHLLSTRHRAVLDIQSEMVDRRQRLDQTAAGQVVEAELVRLRERHERDLQDLNRELQEAALQEDNGLKLELENMKWNVEYSLQRGQENSKALQKSHNDLVLRVQRRYDDETRRLQVILQFEMANKPLGNGLTALQWQTAGRRITCPACYKSGVRGYR